ncbi:MAG: toxin-antitoxin system, antitoxin component [Spirochaetes bacterium]|nr:toxin-antitoxin system, antitoxin component [Spirochaetota bacterium]
MPQISLYIDKETLIKIEKAAQREKISISKWVGKNIKKVINNDYPKGYFDLFGSISDESFDVKKLSFKDDSKRESF